MLKVLALTGSGFYGERKKNIIFDSKAIGILQNKRVLRLVPFKCEGIFNLVFIIFKCMIVITPLVIIVIQKWYIKFFGL